MTEQVGRYDAEDITVLKGLEAVRRRPGMYVGGTDARALHHMVYEVVDNSIDEALAGACDRIEITIHEDDSVTVADNGRGIPVAPHPVEKISALQLVMTTLHAGGKFDSASYKVSGGLHGVGVSAVNALSRWMEVRARRDGGVFQQRYERGIPTGPVVRISRARGKKTGNVTAFLFDDSIFADVTYRFETLALRFREMAFVTKGVSIRFRDERTKPFPRETSYYFEGGITSFVRYLNRNRVTLHQPVYFERRIDDTNIEIALQYTDGVVTSEYAFANTINTVDGGTHVTGLRSAVTRTVNDYARRNNLLKEKDPNLTGEDTREGLTVIVSIKHPDPQFESQTKVKLVNAEVKSQVENVVSEALSGFLESHTREAKRIVAKCVTSARARQAARKARDLVIRKSVLESMTLPGKLADCSERNPGNTELFIVEGDSAGGSAKQGRDRHFQAILPLRGKILNTERARLDRILNNREVRAIISAFGTGIGESFDLGGLRYNRIVILCDADVDGSHIRTLLLTFFFRYMQPLIEAGHLFIAQPPLYQIRSGRKAVYAYAEDEKERLLKSMGEKVRLQRYKGLGEMNPDQLWETTMNPANRTLIQVTIEDAAAADRTFDMLMGSSVPPRRRFIQTRAKEVKNLDI
jgi:DNA gyrase subunit B